MRQFNDEELAALERIVERLEVWLEEYGDTDAASVALVEEELVLVREILAAPIEGETDDGGE